MFKEIRKGLMAGIGAVLLTREKVEEATRKLVKEAKLSEEDARRLTEELVESGEKQFTRLEKALSDTFKGGLDNLGVGRQDAFDRLKHKVDALEIRLSILEKAQEARKEGE
jgi:polyhydroxyalkanoate synthesis regulator phasin